MLVCLTAASCTAEVTSAPDDAAGPTTTTLPNYGSAVTSAPPTTVLRLDSDELAALLPTAEQIGAGYVVDPGIAVEGEASTSQDAWDEAVAEACPELTELTASLGQVVTVAFASSPSHASRLFIDIYGRKVAVALDDGNPDFGSPETWEDYISAVNKCDRVVVIEPQIAGETSMKLHATPDSRYGDGGMIMSLNMQYDGVLLPGRVKVEGSMRIFQQGQTTVTITTVDGLDPDTLRPVRVDHLLAAELAEGIEEKLSELQGG